MGSLFKAPKPQPFVPPPPVEMPKAEPLDDPDAYDQARNRADEAKRRQGRRLSLIPLGSVAGGGSSGLQLR